MQILSQAFSYYKNFGNFSEVPPFLQKGMSLIFQSPLEISSFAMAGLLSQRSQVQSEWQSPGERLGMYLNQKIQQQLLSKIYSFEPALLLEFQKVQERLLKEGEKSISLLEITREIESITNDSSLSTEEKQKKINEVRERSGLTKDEMKHFVTSRLERIYDESKQALEKEMDFLKKDKERIETLYGKNSPEALQATRSLEGVLRVTEPLHRKLQQNQETYHGMYQSGGCLKKLASGIGGIFKGVAQTLWNGVKGIVNPTNWFKPGFWTNLIAPLALNLIPGVGTIAAVGWKWARIAYGAVQAGKSLVQKNWSGALNGIMGVASKISGTFSQKVGDVIQKGTEWVNKTREKINLILSPLGMKW